MSRPGWLSGCPKFVFDAEADLLPDFVLSEDQVDTDGVCEPRVVCGSFDNGGVIKGFLEQFYEHL